MIIRRQASLFLLAQGDVLVVSKLATPSLSAKIGTNPSTVKLRLDGNEFDTRQVVLEVRHGTD